MRSHPEGRSGLTPAGSHREEPARRDPAILPRLLMGFAVALAAAGFWGVGNVVTRWTLRRVPRAAFDVVLLKYLVAATLLVVVALLIRARHGRSKPAPLGLRNIPPGRFLAAALAKGVNTYCWVLAAALLPAGPVATLENLHVVWTGLAVAVLFRERVPLGRVTGQMLRWARRSPAESA